MPETRGERAVFVAGLLVVAALVTLIVTRPQRSAGSPASARVSAPTTTYQPAPAPTTTAAATPTTTAEPAPTTTAAPSPTVATTTAPATAPPSTSDVRLQVTARADTWISIRRSSRTGPVLFEGTLLAGEKRAFVGRTFAVRFGAAANVSARLDGRPLALPGGTYSATITRDGLGSRSA